MVFLLNGFHDRIVKIMDCVNPAHSVNKSKSPKIKLIIPTVGSV